MKREEKTVIINALAEKLQQYPHYYLADIAGLNAENTAALRKKCFEQNIVLQVVKNTLFEKALEQVDKRDEEIVAILNGSTSVMFAEVGNEPAKLLKEFKKSAPTVALKAAYVDECTYVGESNLETLVNIKSRDELLGDVITLLQSPAKNVISALQSSGGKIAGIVKTLSERAE